MVWSSCTRATVWPTGRDSKYASGSPRRCRNSPAPSSTSTRLVVWASTYVRSPPRMTSNTVTPARPMTSTSRVVSPRWISTLSMTTWKNSGVASAKSCRKNETTSTSANSRRYFTTAGMNHVRSNRRSSPPSPARRVTSTSRPVHNAPSSSMSSRRGGRAPSCTSARSSAIRASTRNPPSAKLGDGRKGDLAETPRRGLDRACLQSQPARRSNQVRHRHRVPGRGMLAGNLPRVGRQAVKPQHGGETRRAGIDGLRVVSGWRRERARQPGRPAAGERRQGQLAVDRCRGTGLTNR